MNDYFVVQDGKDFLVVKNLANAYIVIARCYSETDAEEIVLALTIMNND